jgi:hypothetical protein
MKASWRDKEARVTSVDDLRRIIDEVRAAQEPTMLFLETESAETLVVGLGHPESVLTFVQPDGRTLHSLGDTRRTGHLRFWCRDQLDEFMEEMAIPESDAIQAAVQFLEVGGQPKNVRWEADW